KALVGEARARLSTLAAELARPESIGSFYLANDLRRQTRRRLWLLRLWRDRWRQENHLPLLFRPPFASQLLFQWPPAVRTDVEFPAIYLLFQGLSTLRSARSDLSSRLESATGRSGAYPVRTCTC